MLTHLFKTMDQNQRLMVKTWQLWFSAATVVQLRVMQMALGTLRPEEAARMVFEKPAAFASGAERAMRAMAGGKGCQAATLAALAPVSRRAGSNARRLTRSSRRP